MSKEPIIAGEPETIETAVITKPNYEGEITRIIRGNLSPKAMQSRLEDYHGNDIAGAMENLTTAERKKLYRVCGSRGRRRRQCACCRPKRSGSW